MLSHVSCFGLEGPDGDVLVHPILSADLYGWYCISTPLALVYAPEFVVAQKSCHTPKRYPTVYRKAF